MFHSPSSDEFEDPIAEEPDMWPDVDLTDTEREYIDNLARPDDGPLYHEPVYDAMVSRETGGSDPLVQEPKGKP